MTRPASAAEDEGVPFYFTSLLGDNDFLRGHAYYVPVWIRHKMVQADGSQLAMLEAEEKQFANLSPAARRYLATLGLPNPDADPDTAMLIWMHCLAIGFAPDYLLENAGGIRQNWPRMPLPDNTDQLKASAALGARIAALLDAEHPVEGVTAGAMLGVFKQLAVPAGNTPFNLTLNAGWGSLGQDGAVMPGKGYRQERQPTPEEAQDGLGRKTYDVYLNADAYWRNIPERVWEYRIGGYQVIKKWLSYREAGILGRPLTQEEVREVRDMARRLAAILLLEPELNANYANVKQTVFRWAEP